MSLVKARTGSDRSATRVSILASMLKDLVYLVMRVGIRGRGILSFFALVCPITVVVLYGELDM